MPDSSTALYTLYSLAKAIGIPIMPSQHTHSRPNRAHGRRRMKNAPATTVNVPRLSPIKQSVYNHRLAISCSDHAFHMTHEILKNPMSIQRQPSALNQEARNPSGMRRPFRKPNAADKLR